MASAPPVLRGGFRPFFLGGALWAFAALTLWLLNLSGTLNLPTSMDPLAWHRHEMLFGFVGAVIAGFLLTAIPNWTGRLPIAGPPLAAFALLWLAGRLAMFFSGALGVGATAIIDVGFLVLLAAVAAREVVAAKNRNLPIVGMVLLLAGASLIDHLAMAGLLTDAMLGSRLAIGVITMLIALIGGRIIPSFTRNWLVKRAEQDRLPTQADRFDIASLLVTALALAAWTMLPERGATGGALLLAGALQFVRLCRWQGHRTFADPLVLILHVGFLWVPIGLVLLGVSIMTPAIPQSAAVHALTAGAMGTMILAVMTRATLGHTGRELRADRATRTLYVLVTAGAIARVAAPLHLIRYTELMQASALLWAGAFILFMLRYGPILCAPRPGESR